MKIIMSVAYQAKKKCYYGDGPSQSPLCQQFINKKHPGAPSNAATLIKRYIIPSFEHTKQQKGDKNFVSTRQKNELKKCQMTKFIRQKNELKIR